MKTKNLVLTFILLILLSCFYCKSKVKQDIELKTSSKEYTIPFVLQQDRIYLKGLYKDSTYCFILDNGAMVTCLASSLFQHDDTAGFRVSDNILPYSKYDIPTHIKLKDYDLLLNEITITDPNEIRSRALKIEKSVMGIIGVELFANEIIEFNFEDSLMIIKNKLPDNINEYRSFDMLNLKNCTYWFDSLYKQIEIPGFYDHTGKSCKGRLTIDFGTPFVVFNKTILENTDFELSKKDTTTLVALILNNQLNVNTKTTDSFEQRYGDGILGVSFFKNFDVIFDYPHNKLYLKPNKYFKP